MPNIELRWIVPEDTTTANAILQYRDDTMFNVRDEKWWVTVPLVVVDREEFQSAQRS